jgi:hypothetical protein
MRHPKEERACWGLCEQDAYAQMEFRSCSCSGVRRHVSWRAPSDVFGHLEPGFSLGRKGKASLMAFFSWISAGGKPLARTRRRRFAMIAVVTALRDGRRQC